MSEMLFRVKSWPVSRGCRVAWLMGLRDVTERMWLQQAVLVGTRSAFQASGPSTLELSPYKLAHGPFAILPYTTLHPSWCQVEATKYTELGYVGRDVEEIVKDLVEVSVK